MADIDQPIPDGLIIPEVGPQSKQKHHFLSRYLDAFTTAMKDKWNGLHYIDLFAGAGIERIRGTNELCWGSPMLAAKLRFPFTGLHFCEKDEVKCIALRQRIGKLNLDSDVHVDCGNANRIVERVVSRIPRKALSLAFLDPYGLHLRFETVQKLSNRPIDLIIFFPDSLDIIRNWEKVYEPGKSSNLDDYIGDAAWRETTVDVPPGKRAESIRELYLDGLRDVLQYKYFRYERVTFKGRSLYLIIFASRDAAGAKIWDGVQKIEPGGQRKLDFGPNREH